MIKKYLVSLALGASILFSAFEALGYAWIDTNKLSTPRSNTVTVRLPSDKVLIAGGGNVPFGAIHKSVELYDPKTGIFSSTGPMSFARYQHEGTLLANNKVLVCGGFGYAGVQYSSAELYDPDTGTWSNAGAMAEQRSWHRVVLLRNGKVLAVGGWNAATSGYTDSADLYDPNTNSWSATGRMNYGRRDHTALLLLNGKVLVTGGTNNAGVVYLTSAEIYDPDTGTWRTTGSMINGRANHSATLLPNGKVLVTGGNGTSGILSSAEVFDPNTETWSVAGSMSNIRAEHTATLLLNGKVLVVGGNNVDLYDPATGAWSKAGSLGSGMLPPINSHSATLLQNGDVLVAGGSVPGGYALDNASIYSHLPVVSDMSKSMTSDKVLKLGSSDFLANFKDQSKLAAIKILQMPNNGTLTTIDGYSVEPSQDIDIGELFAGGLHYTTNLNTGKDSISWTGSNGMNYALNQAVIDINVSSTVTAIAQGFNKYTYASLPIKFVSKEFKDVFIGSDGRGLLKIKVLTLPKHGVLKVSEVPVTVGQEIQLVDINSLSFYPGTIDWFGETSFMWSGSDGVVYSNSAVVNIDVSRNNC